MPPPSATADQTIGRAAMEAARGVVASATGALAGALATRAATGARYAAFISYSHADMAFARWLHRALETYRVPKALIGTTGEYGPLPARLGAVFRDEDELAGAAELGPKLQSALNDAASLIVVCSPRAARSGWVDKEIRTFKTMHANRPVFAVIARGVPGDAAEECFPEPLRFALNGDGSTDRTRPLEPLAPDAQKLDRRAVRLKLVAGMLGIGYGILADRENRRQRRRTVRIATLSTALIVLLSLLSVTAILSAREAVAERKRAEAARDAAIKARDLADRRAWLAQTAAEQLRLLSGDGACAK